uniref:Uncharacterized protein n=1 Tax=Tanacetum cinerariifolium TaxID=118510 RepID=A0A6L2KJZ3_TANCI|nr:hypothetical protein [Tanacetum cinerariifolium]
MCSCGGGIGCPSIHRDLSRGTKVLDGGSDDLNGGIVVLEVVVKWLGGGICDEVVVKGGRRLFCISVCFGLLLQCDGRTLEEVDLDDLEGVGVEVGSRGLFPPGMIMKTLLLERGIITQDYDSTPRTMKNCALRCGDDVASIKRGRQDFHGDDVRDSTMALGHSRLKVDLESSTCKVHCVLSFSRKTILHFVLLGTVFCSCVLVSAIWFCVLLIEDISCALPREDSAHFKTWLHFVSRLGCVLSQDFLHFVSRPPAFCLKTWLCFVSRLPALSQDLLRHFVSRLGCVLSQDFMRFVSRPLAFCLKTWLHFVSRLPAFCLKTSCVLSQDLLCNTPILVNIAAEANLGYYFIAQKSQS